MKQLDAEIIFQNYVDEELSHVEIGSDEALAIVEKYKGSGYVFASIKEAEDYHECDFSPTGGNSCMIEKFNDGSVIVSQ